MQVLRVAEALARAKALGVDRLDAQLLLAHRLNQPRTWLIAHDDAELAAEAEMAYLRDIQSRSNGVPLAYLVGEREFHGLRFKVTPAVLVPRPETELLVDWALELLAGQTAPRVLDLGTGSGAIAISLAHRRPDAWLTATDIDEAALTVARGNTRALGVAVTLVRSNWWVALDGQRFELVLSNPPYIAADDPHLPALAHEPRHALTPGGDGLDALRQIVAGAPHHLEAEGWLLLEHGHDQGQPVRCLLAEAGFADAQTRRDLAGLERCSGGRWLTPAVP